MHNEKSWKCGQWITLIAIGIPVIIGIVWYALSNLTGKNTIQGLSIISSAEAATVSPALALDTKLSAPIPALNHVLLTSYPDDSLIIDAHNAYLTKNIQALETYMNYPSNHPLHDYIGYWYWKLMLKQSPLTTAFNDGIQSWLTTHPNIVLSERLRQMWLTKQLPSITARFLPQYDQLAKPDDELKCAAWLLRGQPKSEQADELRMWASPHELSLACEQWLGMRTQEGEQTKLRYRLYLAAINNNVHCMARIVSMSMLSLPPNDLSRLYYAPKRWLEHQTRFDSVWEIVALLRLAKDTSAQIDIERYLEQIAPSLRREAYTFVGYEFAKQLQPKAIDYYRKGILSGDLPGDVLIWRMRSMLRQLQWADVLQTVQAVPDALKDQNSAWRYWNARALVELKQETKAKPIFEALADEPYYYGVLAKEALGQSWATITTPVMPDSQVISIIASNLSIQRALILGRLGWRDQGYHEWQWALQNATDEQLNAAAYIALQYQYYDWAINTAGHTKQHHNLALRFLAPYQNLVERAGRQFQISPSWVLGIIRQESRFNTRAHSIAGALGLMQLMPATAREIARKTGLPGHELNTILDPDINIPMGTYYLSELSQHLALPVEAIVAYNAGAKRAHQWQASEALEGSIYVETIPFNETREYVKRVLSNWYFYHRVLGEPGNLMLTKLLGTIPASGENGLPTQRG